MGFKYKSSRGKGARTAGQGTTVVVSQDRPVVACTTIQKLDRKNSSFKFITPSARFYRRVLGVSSTGSWVSSIGIS